MATIKIDRSRGKVRVRNVKTGKLGWLHAVDVREQLPMGLIELVDADAHPGLAPVPPTYDRIDWGAYSFQQIRQFAEKANLKTIGVPREQLQAQLAELRVQPIAIPQGRDAAAESVGDADATQSPAVEPATDGD